MSSGELVLYKLFDSQNNFYDTVFSEEQNPQKKNKLHKRITTSNVENQEFSFFSNLLATKPIRALQMSKFSHDSKQNESLSQSKEDSKIKEIASRQVAAGANTSTPAPKDKSDKKAVKNNQRKFEGKASYSENSKMQKIASRQVAAGANTSTQVPKDKINGKSDEEKASDLPTDQNPTGLTSSKNETSCESLTLVTKVPETFGEVVSNLSLEKACDFYLNQTLAGLLKLSSQSGGQTEAFYNKLLESCFFGLDLPTGKKSVKNSNQDKPALTSKQLTANRILLKHFQLINSEVISAQKPSEILFKISKIVRSAQKSSLAENVICEFLMDKSLQADDIQIINLIFKGMSTTPDELKLKLVKTILALHKTKELVGVNWLEIGGKFYKSIVEGQEVEPFVMEANAVALDCLLIWFEKFKVDSGNSAEDGLHKLADIATKCKKDDFHRLRAICQKIPFEKISPENLKGIQDIFYSLLFRSIEAQNGIFEDKKMALFFFCENIRKISECTNFLMKNRFNNFFKSIDKQIISSIDVEALEKIFKSVNHPNGNSSKKSLLVSKNLSNYAASQVFTFLFDHLYETLPVDKVKEAQILRRMVSAARLAKTEINFTVSPAFLKRSIDSCEWTQWNNYKSEEEKTVLVELAIDCMKVNDEVIKKEVLYTEATLDFFRKCISMGMKNFKSFVDENKNNAFFNFLNLFSLTMSKEVCLISKGLFCFSADSEYLLKNEAASLALSQRLIESKSHWVENQSLYWLHYYVLDASYPKISYDSEKEDESKIEIRKKGLTDLVADLTSRKQACYGKTALRALTKNMNDFSLEYDELLEQYNKLFSVIEDIKENHLESYEHWLEWSQGMNWAQFPKQNRSQKLLHEFFEKFVSLHTKLTMAKVRSLISKKCKGSKAAIRNFCIEINKICGSSFLEIRWRKDWEFFKGVLDNIIGFITDKNIKKFLSEKEKEPYNVMLIGLSTTIRGAIDSVDDKECDSLLEKLNDLLIS